MNKKHLVATICIQVTCLCAIAWILTANSVASVKAYLAYQEPTDTPTPTATPTPTPLPPFLGAIYYDKEYIWQIFDHQLPGDYAPFPAFPGVRHYDFSLHNPPEPGYGYEGHIGIDYSLKYEPVLASAEGTVEFAGWQNESNHRAGLGLYVRMSYNANPDYRTFYGHLSTLNVQTGDEIDIDLNDPGKRNRIIGISGNTGHVFNSAGNDCEPIPVSGPHCGHHLHFETRRNGVFVNPYGWISGTPDPWAQHQNGTISHYLWANQPAVLSTQYIASGPQGTPVNDPGVNNARMIIDDGSADFFPGSCWTFAGGAQSYNNGYYRAPSDGEDNCTARWTIRGDAFTEPGEYDVFAHIPAHANPSLSVAYDVHHNNQVSRAIAVQAAYVGNEEHDAWAYLGRYDFAMSDSVSEFILVHDHDVFHEDNGRYTLADAIMLAPANAAMPLPQRYLYVSFASSGYAGNVPYENEDILLFDAATGEWHMFFDGSDVGLAAVGIDAFDFRSRHLFFSLNAPLGSYTASDIIRFVPASLGEDTSGTMSVYIPGEKLGLIPAEFPGENIDALTFNDQGKIVLSTQGQAEIGSDIFEDEDLFINESDTLASMFFDGSAYALNAVTENVNGAWLAGNGRIYLSTTGSFAVSGVSGDGADIFVCAPGIFQNCWFEPGLFWNGSAHGIPNTSIDDFYLGGYIQCDNLPLNCSFEQQFVHWTVEVPNPDNTNWVPTMSESHGGWYSAMAEVHGSVNDVPNTLTSSPIPIQATGVEYRFSFYGKGGTYIEVVGNYQWNNGVSQIIAITSTTQDWSLYSTNFVCPLNGATAVQFVFDIQNDNFTLSAPTLVGNQQIYQVFIDDVRIESRPNANCGPLNSENN